MERSHHVEKCRTWLSFSSSDGFLFYVAGTESWHNCLCLSPTSGHVHVCLLFLAMSHLCLSLV